MIYKLIHKAKQMFPDFKYYAVGSWVRNEPDFKDYDILISPPTNDVNDDWEKVLSLFDNQMDEDGKYVDAHIFPIMEKLITLNPNEVNKIKDEICTRYFYSETRPDIPEVSRCGDNLWVKNRKVIMDKHQAMNLHNSRYIHKEL